jgi:threonine dehydrogenase-like Zn-dependent dehydrogenase
MKALTIHGRREIRHETVADPVIEAPKDAIVKVRLAGLCGSDLHPYHGREQLDPGTVMGHEFVGEVVETGAAVRQIKVGDKVFSPFSTSCGTCFFCRNQLPSRCVESQLFGGIENGHGIHGAQAELVRVPLADGTLLPIPDGVTDEQALLLGDIFSTGYFCAEMAGVKPGGVYAVVGCGPVGILAIISALELGGEQIYAIDSVEKRLALARELGARPIDLDGGDPVDAIRAMNAGRGVDAVLEAVGSRAAEELAFHLVRPGGTIAVVGVHHHDFSFTPGIAYDKNLTYRVGRCPARHYMKTLPPLVLRSRHDITCVISHRLPLAQGPRAYEIFDRKEDDCTKAVFELGQLT